MLGRRKEIAESPAVPPGDSRPVDHHFAPTEVRSAPALQVHKRLGDLLMEERLITPEQLKAAIAIQHAKGGFLGQVLVQEGFVTQNQVASCLVKQCKIPHLSLLDYEISPAVMSLVPQGICEKYRLLPIDKLGRILTLAMVDPLDLDALEEVRQICPELRIKPILCNWEHFQTVYQRAYGTDKNKEGQQVMTAKSLGLSERPAEKAPLPKPAPAASPPSTPPGNTIEQVVQQAIAAARQEETVSTSPAMTSEEVSAAVRTGMQEFRSWPAPAAPKGAPVDSEAIAVVMRETLQEFLETSRKPPPEASPGITQENVARVLRESLRDTLAESQRHQRDQEDRLARIAESILLSVQQNHQLMEQRVVQEGVRRDLSDAGTGRKASVVPFQRYRDGRLPGEESLERQEGDTRLIEALYSEEPLETLTFDNFFPGAANDFTFRLGKAVADQPGQDYNPFFLYGHVGIGKTHLINAMGNSILAQHPAHRVGYISASHFSRRVQEATQERTLDDFRENFSHWDVLILDDIQFLGGRVEAQEEFFHIFNVLHQQSRQIIIASDKPPDRLGLLEQRLISRFAGGIVAELKAPEWETRTKILRHRLTQLENPLPIPDEVLSLVAMRVPNDIRKMTGALRKIIAYARLAGQEISLEMAGEILKHLNLPEHES